MFKLIKNLNYIWNKFKGANNEFWESIEEELILNNVSIETANIILKDIREYCLKNNVNSSEEIKKLLKEKIKNILISEKNLDISKRDITETNNKPTVMLIIGVNGVGKTSSIAKLAYLFKKEGKSVLIAAADTFRAAAIEQIQFFGEKMGIEVIKHQRNSDPAKLKTSLTKST
jgi:fused signal recognition particle receptor